MLKVTKLNTEEKPVEKLPVEKPIEESIIEEINLPPLENNVPELPEDYCNEPELPEIEEQEQPIKRINPMFAKKTNYNNILFWGLGAALFTKLIF
jgi:hypothetical protein